MSLIKSKVFRTAFIALSLGAVSLFARKIYNQHRAYIPQEFTGEDSPSYHTESTETLYGLSLQEFDVIEDVVKENQTFSVILNSYNVPNSLINELVQKSQGVFDMNKLGVGKKYTMFCSKDSLKVPKYFIYEPNSTEYFVFDLRYPAKVYKVEKEVSTTEKSLGGIIERSLYHTIAEKGVDVTLTNKLADIFKWTIDFFALDKGDRFRILYQETSIEGVPVSTGRINGASFTHRGKTFYAIYFEKDGKGGYYDLDGNALKSRFLQAPLEFTRISSKYNLNRVHPILKRVKPHLGTDYAAPHGTPIVAVADGIVEEATQRGGNGKFVKIKHDNVYSTQYLHMSRFAEGIRKGVKVQQGQVIGYVGSTGLATGPHLCFRFWKNGQQVNPFKELPKNGEPLPQSVKPEYLKWKDNVVERLNMLGYHNNIRTQTAENIRQRLLN